MPNNFAYVVLLSWPLVVLYLLNRFKIGNGSLLALLLSYMFLPANMSVDLPVLPPLDKFSVTTLTILTVLVAKKLSLGFNFLPRIYRWLIAVIFIAPFFTAMNNSERYMHIPGLTLYDGLTTSIVSFLYFFPFLIGVKYFRDQESHTKLFQYFALATLAYAFLALYEIRMSPSLHSTLYGYFPHSWRQQYRDGGFRAVVFMGHGLLVAIFIALGVGFWAAIQKSKLKVFRYSATVVLAILALTLILMKTYSAFLYGLFVYVAITFLPKNQQILASMLIALLFLTYPISSATGLFPHKELISIAEELSADRAASLNYRFENENILLSHANEKPLFGWGGWGRNRVFDPITGEDITVTDGYWVIVLGTSGWVGFLSKFLFLFLPIVFLFKNYTKMNVEYESTKTLLVSHALIISLIMIDQIPNSSFSSNSLYWLLAGSLLGRLDELTKHTRFTSNN
ncbi:MAG: hypothetical protein CMH22_11470 [Methylophaga sp.]|uniref:hypothetical protein n=1 Tax=Methylophaga sp. UBA678 TaxID=1946901 RepID=UPI000C4F7BFC|nr:hypothetical protein [Methylophaga sp. UBA678]MAX52590.1 hypothetical protein [Methylophaga sp.]|tara:strand:- start:31959 stop:33320 length:1362 start_codon:yes stop_codon:yes gene_type:complete